MGEMYKNGKDYLCMPLFSWNLNWKLGTNVILVLSFAGMLPVILRIFEPVLFFQTYRKRKLPIKMTGMRDPIAKALLAPRFA